MKDVKKLAFPDEFRAVTKSLAKEVTRVEALVKLEKSSIVSSTAKATEIDEEPAKALLLRPLALAAVAFTVVTWGASVRSVVVDTSEERKAVSWSDVKASGDAKPVMVTEDEVVTMVTEDKVGPKDGAGLGLRLGLKVGAGDLVGSKVGKKQNCRKSVQQSSYCTQSLVQ